MHEGVSETNIARKQYHVLQQADRLQARVGIRGEHEDARSPFAEVTIWIGGRDVRLSELNQRCQIIDAARAHVEVFNGQAKGLLDLISSSVAFMALEISFRASSMR